MVPGDSFPATGNHLVAISMNDIDEETSEDEQELLKRSVYKNFAFSFRTKPALETSFLSVCSSLGLCIMRVLIASACTDKIFLTIPTI